MYKSFAGYRMAWDNASTKDPPIPLNLDIELASACNAKCTFCLYGDQDWRKDMEQKDWDGLAKKRFMPTDMAKNLIDEAVKLGIPAIKTNFRGESTIHKDYSEIMHYAQTRRVEFKGEFPDGSKYTAYEPAFFEILVNTNANCSMQAIDGLMCATKVMVSLDSMDPNIYPKIRVGLSLEKAVATIDELVNRCHGNLWVRRVVCKENKDEPFVESVKKRWPKGVKVSEHSAFDRNHYQNQEIAGEDHTKWERTFCEYPSQRIVVTASGRYSPCCISWEDEFYQTGLPGKYPELSLKEYWESEWRKNLSNELRQNIFKNEKCKKCTTYRAFKRPERDFVQDVAL